MKMSWIKKDNNILVSNRLVDFFDPREIYVPILRDGELNIKTKNVKKGELLFKNVTNNIFCPVSGSLKDIVTLDNKKYLVVENNFKEELKVKNIKKIKFKSEEIFDLIKKYYPNFNLEKNNNILYFKGLVDDMYNANNYFIFKKYQDDILDILDILREIYGYEEIRILLKENDSENISLFSNVLGRYPFINILLLPDIYPIANNEVLFNYFKEKVDVLGVHEVLKLIYAIFYRQPFMDCYLTVSGNIKHPVVVKVKAGTRLTELLNKLQIDEHEAYINSIFSKKQNIDQIIIDDSIYSVLFFDEVKRDVKPCISCGKCLSVCPMGCEVIFNKKMDNCISCGLCEYVCPSYIKLIDKEKVKR